MTQLEKSDLPVNHHYGDNQVLKMIGNNSSDDNPNPSTRSENVNSSSLVNGDVEEVVIGVDIEGLEEEEEIEQAKEEELLKSPEPETRGMTIYDFDEETEKTGSQSQGVVGVGVVEADEGESIVHKRARLMGPQPIRINTNAIPLPSPGIAYGGNQSCLALETGLTSAVRSPPRRLFDSVGSSGSGSLSNNVVGASKMPGVVGLSNLGNTCFMNSGLQSLLSTPPVVEFFLKSQSIQAIAPPPASLTLSFQQLVRNAWYGPSTILQPREFKDKLGNIFPQFKDCRQHDCQEFLALTLDTLHEQLKIWNNSKRRHLGETNSSGFASGQTDSGCGESAVNDSDVSSSLQSPASGSNGETDNAPQDGVLKKGRLNEELESTPNLPGLDIAEKEMALESRQSSPAKDSDYCDAGAPAQAESEENETEDMDIESELDGDESENDKEKRSLKEKTKLAEGFWMNYIRDNNTVIASSFQGMYKSTVTCSVCNYVSCTFEPFMYLSLPIPGVTERHLDVMFSSTSDYQIQQVSVTMNVNDTVGQLKEKVIEKVFQEIQLCVPPSSNFVVAEVVNYYVHNILKDDQPLKNVKDGIYNIYVLELNQNFTDPLSDTTDTDVMGSLAETDTLSPYTSSFRPNTYLDEEDWENEVTAQPLHTPTCSNGGGFIPASSSTSTCGPADGVEKQESMEYDELVSCSVCLEDLPKSKLKQHYGCSCILCSECITKTAECFSSNETVTSETAAAQAATSLKCPVCSEIVDYRKNFAPLVSGSSSGPRKLTFVPVLFYHGPSHDSNNNSTVIAPKFIGHPLVVQLPATMPANEFYDFIAGISPFRETEYVVKNASWDGKECGGCFYSRTCSGCEYEKEGIISISSRNSILISYPNLSADLIQSIEPPTMATCANPYSVWSTNQYKEEVPVDIYECLDTFSQIEHLDEHNPWFCSQCKKRQCATKSLTICRFPDYLIVYLKRFVFMDHSSNKLNNKLNFPIEDFDVSKYIAEEFAGGEHIYDLYSCVCHFGSASGGHYTSYSKNPKFGEWHYFNDDTVSRKCPAVDEYSSGYILFYAKKGVKSDIVLKGTLSSTQFTHSSAENSAEETCKSEECDTTTTPTNNTNYPLFASESLTDPVALTTSNQDDMITSTTCSDSNLTLNEQLVALCQKNPLTPSYVSLPSSSPDRVKRVGENVANLRLDTNSRKRPAPCTATSSSTSTATSASEYEFENTDESSTPPVSYRTYAELSRPKYDSKRLAKSAHHKFPESTSPSSSSGLGRRF